MTVSNIAFTALAASVRLRPAFQGRNINQFSLFIAFSFIKIGLLHRCVMRSIYFHSSILRYSSRCNRSKSFFIAKFITGASLNLMLQA